MVIGQAIHVGSQNVDVRVAFSLPSNSKELPFLAGQLSADM